MSAALVEIAQQSGRRERAGLFEAGNEPCGKRCTAIRQPPGRRSPRRSRSEGATRWIMPRRSRWPCPVMCRDRATWLTVWPVTIQRTRRCNSCICRRCGPSSHWTHVIRQRRFNRCRRPPASTSPSAASASIGCFGKLYPIYVRGLAYLAAQQPVEAAAEFQRIVDHRSIVLVDPIDPFARLQLARALALSGDTVKAKGVYSDLLTLWKNADADIPVLKEARAEYARLPL